MKATFIMASTLALLLSITTSCSNQTTAFKGNLAPKAAQTTAVQSPAKVNCPIRQLPDVHITFENHKAYDAVQLGLSLLHHSKEMGHVPNIEDPEFFPDFFSMINVDISDGLLLVTEEEAANFAREAYLEYQKTNRSRRLSAQQEQAPHCADDFICAPRD